MKVIHVVRQYRPSVGGMESFVHHLCQEMKVHGIDSEVVTLDRLFTDPSKRLPAKEVESGIPVRRISYVGGRRFFLAPGILRTLGGADVVHVHAIDFFLDTIAATRIIHRKPIVVSTHGGYFHTTFLKRFKHVVFHTVTRASLRRAARIIAVSYSDYETFRRISKRVELLENGVDVARWLRLPKVRQRGRWLYVGRLSPNKRLDRLVETIGFLVAAGRDVHLDVVGPDEDGTAQALRQVIEGRGLRDRIRLHGQASESELEKLQGTAECVVMASEYEGFGIAVVESMAAGTIPILNDIPCFRALVKDDETGLLVNFDDPGKAARDILNRLPPLLEEFETVSMRVREAARAHDWSVVGAKWAELYRDVGGRTRRCILGVPIKVTTTSALSADLEACIRMRTRCRVAFANSHTLNVASRDVEFLQVLRRFTVVNDGLGVDLASRRLYGRPFPENLNGTDFVPRFLRSIKHPVSVYLFGGTPGVAETAGAILERLSPAVRLVGTQHGYVSAKDDLRVVEGINAARPDVLLVGLGNPAQEKWIAEHEAALCVPVCIGVGALFDFMSGRVRRAPGWLRRLRSEWFFRLLVEPRRLWRRYLVGNVVFLWRVARYGHRSPTVTIASSPASAVGLENRYVSLTG